MTGAELALPWPAFVGLPDRWSALVHDGRDTHRLWDREVLDLCRAVELDRVAAWDVPVLLARRRRAERQLAWSWLMGGADGLERDDAPGELSLGECIERAGLTLESAEVGTRRERRAA